MNPGDHHGNEHERPQIDEGVHNDRHQDAAGSEIQHHEQRSDHGRGEDADDTLVKVQQPEQQEARCDRKQRVSRHAEDERGQREAKQQFLDDPGIDRESRAEAQFRAVTGQ